jgi:hypothetical protein
MLIRGADIRELSRVQMPFGLLDALGQEIALIAGRDWGFDC